MKEQKLTNEEIAKVLTLYWGQKVYGDLQDDNEQANYGEAQMDFDNLEYCVTDGMRLLLTPLSKITDKHALEFAKIEMHHSVWTSDVGRNRLALELKEAVMNDGYKYGPISYRTFQYLISKGYAVPLWFGIDHWANGKTAIELGIAIETPTP